MAAKQLAQEYPPPEEAAVTHILAERLKAKVLHDYPTGIKRRDAHAKMHGVLKAEFIVEPDLPPELRVGVFKEAKTYQAWVRYSNQDGVINPDIKGDLRGMAIKLMGVPGEKLLQQEKDEQTQDFILCSNPAFFTRDVKQFYDLIKALTTSNLAFVWFLLTHWKVVWILIKAIKKIANPLQIRYWSTTPYLFGRPDAAVKYTAIPRVDIADTIPANPDPNFLRQAMVRQLGKGEAWFDFAVQFQTDADKMLIEDASQEWSETDSPFRKVAAIRILQQEFDTPKQDEFGENLSFTPWHSLPEHRPLGGTNRARKMVYEFISLFRHQANQAPRREPTGWEI